MKIMKKIIIRIIVAVAVAVIFSKLKLIGIMKVNALEVYTQQISDMCAYNMSGNLIGCPSLTRYNFNQNFEISGWSHNSQSNFQTVSFLVPRVNNLSNKTFKASGSFITTSTLFNNNIKIMAKDGDNNVSVCSNIVQDQAQTIGNYNVFTFECDVFFGSSGALRFYVEGPFMVEAYNSFWVSKVTYIYDNDLLLAQNATNTHLQNLRSQLTSTNSKLDNILSALEQQNQTQTQIQNNTKETNDLIKSDDTTESNAKGKEFFDDFDTGAPQGLSGIISAPLRLISSLSSSTCSPLTFPLPFIDQDVSLPCMSTVYSQFPTFYNLWQLITTGLIGYWVCINLFRVVKGLQNPDDDRIEVLDL